MIVLISGIIGGLIGSIGTGLACLLLYLYQGRKDRQSLAAILAVEVAHLEYGLRLYRELLEKECKVLFDHEDEISHLTDPYPGLTTFRIFDAKAGELVRLTRTRKLRKLVAAVMGFYHTLEILPLMLANVNAEIKDRSVERAGERARLQIENYLRTIDGALRGAEAARKELGQIAGGTGHGKT